MRNERNVNEGMPFTQIGTASFIHFSFPITHFSLLISHLNNVYRATR